MKKQVISKEYLKETIKYIIVGLMNTIIAFLAYYIVFSFTTNYLLALAALYIAGILNSFFWNKYWTFESKGDAKKEFSKFIIVYIITFIINYLLLLVLVGKLNLDKSLAGIVSVIIAIVVSYIGNKLWSFRI